MPDNHLTNGFFRKLFAQIPQFKAKAAELKSKALVSNIERNAHQPMPCAICFTAFDGYNGFAQKKKPYCESCQKNLDEGYTACVTLDGKRFSFTRFPEATPEQRAAVAGKVKTVSHEQMDRIEKSLVKTNGSV